MTQARSVRKGVLLGERSDHNGQVLLTISTTHAPATDLGYLLHKHPDRVQQFRTGHGTSTVFYPEATPQRCTVALLLEVDPLALARSRTGPDVALAQYVNDRPYAASSLLSSAMAHVFSTARTGRCDARQQLADSAIPLEITIPVMPAPPGLSSTDPAGDLFTPLGWQVDATPIPVDEEVEQWGDSRYVHLRLTGTLRLADALNQLYVLLPVLDESVHYWQTSDEVDKLLRVGGSWLADHPLREQITRRYLRRSRDLTSAALARLAEADGSTLEDRDPAPADAASPVPLRVQRQEAVHRTLSELGARSVIDLGCGPGALLQMLARDSQFTRIAGSDVSTGSLRRAATRLNLEELSAAGRDRLDLFQGALTYVDDRFTGFDAAVLMEVIEHVDPARLPALTAVVFGAAAPTHILVTTPNAEYNALYPDLVGMRHRDHRFEWSRSQFTSWCSQVAAEHGYQVRVEQIGPSDPNLGSPTQMGVFSRV